ncbi:MAG TPA: YbaB/EbfC family nucleoid-associated protein [Acidimicrobiales bacterium]|nr:YbaB/EbfC family nucleoid-associated protein [Acidimicrobiales bacterium]
MSDDESSDLPVQPDAIAPGPSAATGDDADPLAGLLGGLDMGSLLSMAGEMQQQMEHAKAEAAATDVEGSAGGGAVRITLTGAMECTGVSISPEATADVDMLEDLVLSALRDALAKARSVQGDDPLGGLGDQLGGLGGLFGD